VSNGDSVPTLAEVMAHLKLMSEAMGDVKADIKGIYRNQTEILEKLSASTVRQETIEKDIDELTKLVRDGNGQPSIMHRLSAVETQQGNHGNEIDKLRGHYNAWATAKTLSKGQMIAGIIGMAITALLALTGVIIGLFK
jgi:hypothetical protein